jgi:hypothetical protein
MPETLWIQPAEAPHAPSSTFPFNPRWFRKFPPLLIAERPSLGGAWFSRATWEGFHTAYSANIVAAVFVFFCLLYWAYLLYHFFPVYPCFVVWVFVTQYTFEITFNGPCLELMGPHLRKYCPRVFSFLVSILGCPGPSVVYFLFCCNWLPMYL